MSEIACPCGLGPYAECCQPLHLGTSRATTAAQLMRSRYSAFALEQIDYIVQTTAIGQQQGLDRAAIADWAAANQWLGLEVLQAKEKLDKTHAQVEFKAHYRAVAAGTNAASATGTAAEVHHEVSHFVWHAEQCYFLDPTTEQVLTMKQPCLCGSQKKFKQCCAAYIT